ncbi:uncharacterized protein BT62DRAFT_320834 [Guyanagaster necrorhizus]|uniref:Endoplasmic reticulum-based factor for assembly of V-ATPase-domain-containing protein n=1 Tax=Guyanagaster necrorhizus TaxID=856835 RepID=A0A9P7VNK5_9AGAR|nr:uncharacterized protein BT62DRAFT_320834 [Guyanagaster necrorhizus MCA 3950]KAG7443625.1 hypothetical protein BT62DRAFT_320834 [Guyanagaster necrorhizus MCA 3950]
MTSDLNISLEDHLRDTLSSVQRLLPCELSAQLQIYFTQPKPALIPYTVLQSVSQWSRSPSGSSALRSATPPRDPNNFSMVSLLAGTTTSPERKFGSYVLPRDPEEIEAERKRERRAITTLMNALLSVGGSGFAAWWASQHAGWKKEWRALFGLFVGFVVAIAEAVLYLIWKSRHSAPTKKTRRRHQESARHKKNEGDGDSSIVETEYSEARLRRRGNPDQSIPSE